MNAVYSVFVVSVGTILYAWAGYPLFISTLALLFTGKRNLPERPDDPLVAVIVPVHNEEQRVAGKLENCLELLYPHNRLEIIVASVFAAEQIKEIPRRFLRLLFPNSVAGEQQPSGKERDPEYG